MTNVIEDMYIEKCLEKEFAGQVIKALCQNREYEKAHYGNSDELEKLAIEGKLSQVHAFTYLLHDYCNVHAFKGDENWVELKPAHDLLEKLKPSIDELKDYRESTRKNKLLTMIAKEMLSLMDNTPKMQMQGQGGSSDSQDDSSQQGQQGQGSSSCQNQQKQEGGQNQNQGSGQDENSNQSSNQNQGSNGGGKTRVAPNGKREKDLCQNKLGGETNSMLNSTGRKPKDKFEPTSSKQALEERREEAGGIFERKASQL